MFRQTQQHPLSLTALPTTLPHHSPQHHHTFSLHLPPTTNLTRLTALLFPLWLRLQPCSPTPLPPTSPHLLLKSSSYHRLDSAYSLHLPSPARAAALLPHYSPPTSTHLLFTSSPHHQQYSLAPLPPVKADRGLLYKLQASEEKVCVLYKQTYSILG